MTAYDKTIAAINELKKVGMSAQETHDLLNELRDCINDHQTCHSVCEAVMQAASWIERDEEEAELERQAKHRNYVSHYAMWGLG